MNVRYRILHAAPDAEAARIASEDFRSRANVLVQLDRDNSPFWEVPAQISETEGEADYDGFLEMLRAGEILPRDLVNIGDGWIPIEDCPLFEEPAGRVKDARRRVWTLVGGAAFVLGVAVFWYVMLRGRL